MKGCIQNVICHKKFAKDTTDSIISSFQHVNLQLASPDLRWRKVFSSACQPSKPFLGFSDITAAQLLLLGLVHRLSDNSLSLFVLGYVLFFPSPCGKLATLLFLSTYTGLVLLFDTSFIYIFVHSECSKMTFIETPSEFCVMMLMPVDVSLIVTQICQIAACVSQLPRFLNAKACGNLKL